VFLTNIANVTALAAARERAVPGSRQAGTPAGAVAYCSSDAHYSIVRAIELLGIGSDNLRAVPIDELRRMRPEALDDMIRADLASGRTPIAVVGTAGTTLTGAIDPLDAIADICADHGIWMHVDGAYGLPAASVMPECFAGLERDSGCRFALALPRCRLRSSRNVAQIQRNMAPSFGASHVGCQERGRNGIAARARTDAAPQRGAVGEGARRVNDAHRHVGAGHAHATASI
jgi:hypothetical protein